MLSVGSIYLRRRRPERRVSLVFSALSGDLGAFASLSQSTTGRLDDRRSCDVRQISIRPANRPWLRYRRRLADRQQQLYSNLSQGWTNYSPEYIMRPVGTCMCARFLMFYYRAMLCIRGTSHGPVSVCLSVRHKPVFY